MTTRLGVAVAVVALGVSPAYAQEQPQSLSELQTTLRIGQNIEVVDASRTIIRGRFEGLSSSSLRLALKGTVIDVQEATIYKVRRERRELDGVLIGLVLGALVGRAYVRHECKGHSEHGDCLRAGSLVIAAPLAAAGALIDFKFRRFLTIFERAIGPP